MAYKWLAMGVLLIGVFMALLDTTIVNIAIPKMMAVFNANTTEIQWVVTGYMLTVGVLVPLTGYLQEVYGGKRLYVFSLAVFTLGSALCGIAWSNASMVVFRVIQAVGGGMIMPVAMSMMFTLVPPHERGTAMGIFGIALMMAPAIGPTLSGYIVEHLDWRLIFTINIPIGIAGVLAAMALLRDGGRTNPGKPFDYPGFFTSTIGLFTLLLALDQGGTEGWDSLYILSLFAIAAVSLTAFVWIELRHPHPMLDLRLFQIPAFTLSVLVASVTFIALFVGAFLIPLFLQNVMRLSPLQAGLALLPAAVATGIMMPVSGKLFDRFGPRLPVVTGLTIATLLTWQFHLITAVTPLATIVLWYTVRGLGVGLCMMPATTAGMNAIPPHKVPQGTALSTTARQIAASFGVAIFSTILSRRMDFHAAALREGLTTTSSMTPAAVAKMQGLFTHAGWPAAEAKTAALQLLSGLIQQKAFVEAMDDVFVVTTFVTLGGLALGLFLRKTKTAAAQGHPEGRPAAHPVEM